MKPNETFIIRHKETKELFSAQSGKTSWKAPGHAKNAFNLTVMWDKSCEKYGLVPIEENKSWGLDIRGPKFDEQSLYEIVELKHETDETLGKALLLLKEVFERERSISWGLADRIEKLLIDNSIEIDYKEDKQ